ncbi:S8 family serine peptidase [Microbulbifer sp. OS29]|uniref:S8 family serine peptidase n=1 Tax=Microbulbifer okhotskensis TaxID=2926617 RepID=A0A9X2EIX9_9GAMM|nr:S8 family serine peptidase [Microbulbifer okhotskensis]MCO1333082.1 S8 family serine peptidase [Microbulbifer okhotskensis]
MKIKVISALLAGLLLSGGSMAASDSGGLNLRSEKQRKVYIVQLDGAPLSSYSGTIPGLSATKPSNRGKLDPHSSSYRHYSDFLKSRRQQVLSAIPSAHKVHEYDTAFNGFAAVMSEKDAAALRNRRDVKGVWEDRLLKPHTDSTADFLGITRMPSPWLWGITGEDIVVGIIDSGIHPEHLSVADMATPRQGNLGREIPYGPIPDTFTSEGCEFGNVEYNPSDAEFSCNNKLIKAKSFSEAFLSSNVLADYEFMSARDADGHGTHTATTAAGNYGVVTPDGKVLTGMAPRARIAAYKVCWDAPDPDDSGCSSADSMAAIDEAVADGVDVINFSIGGASTTFNGADDIAFLFAADAGVFVATSAGNNGPGPQTMGTPSGVPWITAVGASEDEQSYGLALQVSSEAISGTYEGREGNGSVGLESTGALSGAVVRSEPLEACSELTNSEAVEGQIALVKRGGCSFTDKYLNAAQAGAVAIVVYNDGTAEDRMDPIVMSAPDTAIPGMMIRYADGELLAGFSGLNGILDPGLQVPREDRTANFSSRGYNAGAPDIIKPDIAAPGVGILAGTSPVLSGGSLFGVKSGTSMASPHVAGIMALLKQAHPDWSPAMAKSALMTTARNNLLKSYGPVDADPFDIGAGAIAPTDAFKPGLVYDAGFNDYLAFLCGAEFQPQMVDNATCDTLTSLGYSLDSSDLNLASMAVADLVGSQTIKRRVTSVAPGQRWYWATINAPQGIDVSVNPKVLRLREGESAEFEITVTSTDSAAMNEWVFGELTWKSVGTQIDVRSPIAIRPVPLSAPKQLSASGTDGSLDLDVHFGYDGDYQVDLIGLAEGEVTATTIEDGDIEVIFFDIPEGTQQAHIAMFDADVGDGSGGDDLDLEVYGPAPNYPEVGTSGNATSAESVTLVSPSAGQYAAVVVDYATAAGPTNFSLFNFNLAGDAGNTTVDAPTQVQINTNGSISLDWINLTPNTRALGILIHGNGEKSFAETEIMVNTQ